MNWLKQLLHRNDSPAGRRPASPAARLRLEQLEGRLALSTTTLDLTTRGAEAAAGGVIFQQCDAQPTGTGIIQSFLRVRNANAGSSLEQGFNTDARPLQFDELRSPQFTRSLHLSEVPQVTVGGQVYREFLLDINQKSSQPLLTLDQLNFYVGGAPDLTGYDPDTGRLAGLDPVYRLDAGADVDYRVLLDYRLNSGSGSGDLFVLVPNHVLARPGADPFVYLYSKFGEGFDANAGFEEWAVRPGAAPQVATSSLSGFVFLDRNNDGVFDVEDAGIAGVLITLTGVNDLGQAFTLTATTDADGFYNFGDLRPGTYTLSESQPDPYFDGIDTIGTQGGQAGNDLFFDIDLADGVYGINNNFAELELIAGSSDPGVTPATFLSERAREGAVTASRLPRGRARRAPHPSAVYRYLPVTSRFTPAHLTM